MTDYNGCYIIIKNVPCKKCTQCGEEYLSGDTLEKIEEIIHKLKGFLSEIARIPDENQPMVQMIRKRQICKCIEKLPTI